MNSDELIKKLSTKLPKDLAKDLISGFSQLRLDVASETLEKSSPGKFIETIVQVLQFLDNGTYDKTPKVDFYLKNLENQKSNLSENLRITLARVARASYTLRNKRSIAHKGEVDPNIYDLRYLFSASQWLLTELIRHIISGNMSIAGKIIDQIQIPISPIVEEFEGKRLVLKSCTSVDELLILLFHYFPEYTSISQIHLDMNRRDKSTVSNVIKSTYNKKLIEGDKQKGYKLTSLGYREATTRIQK
jgi:hypothetical protein